MPEVITFGCRLNSYESEAMRQHAEKAGLENAVIFNTCAVTAEAERQARQAIRRMKRERPDATIIVTGCAAETNPSAYSAMPEVDRIIGNDAKMMPETFANMEQGRVSQSAKPPFAPEKFPIVRGFEGLARAFVQVQQGCDHRCTFCIIPYGRGPSRSVPMGLIAEQVRTLVEESGYNEIVFSGVDIASYGADLPGRPTLGQMARRVLALNPKLPRLRLSSLDPANIDDDLWRLVEDEPRLMPHLHLSMQSGDDMVLKRMKRRHGSRDLETLCERARRLRPDMIFGADIIAGFPTEDEAMFANTMRMVDGLGLTWLHVFPYSPRAGTPAAKMPQTPRRIVRERAARLRAAGETAVLRHIDALAGKRIRILAENPDVGRTDGFAPVRVAGGNLPTGKILTVLCSGRDGTNATAERCEEE